MSLKANRVSCVAQNALCAILLLCISYFTMSVRKEIARCEMLNALNLDEASLKRTVKEGSQDNSLTKRHDKDRKRMEAYIRERLAIAKSKEGGDAKSVATEDGTTD